MGRQSLRSPFPIAARTSSINAETGKYDRTEKPVSKKASRDALRGGSSGKNQAASKPREKDHSVSSTTARELRVRASSPLLGRSYHSSQSSTHHSFHPPPEMPKLRQSGSAANLTHDRNAEVYAFDTQSQRNLAYGMVEDMRGIGFPHLDKGSKSSTSGMSELPTNSPKRKPSRLDLSLLFPKPKPTAAPLLSPQRYTQSPSPVTSEYPEKPPPNKLSKPRRNIIAQIPVNEAPPPIEHLPPIRRLSQKPMDWFDVPLEKIIRLGESLEVEFQDAENAAKAPAKESGTQATITTRVDQPPPPKPPAPKPPVVELPAEINHPKRSSVAGSERVSHTPSIASRRTSRDSRLSGYNLNRQKLPPPSLSRTPGSLQSWQSEGDLRSKKNQKGRLSKMKSSSTFMTMDLTKSSFLSLSSSESESEDDNCAEEDEFEGERILSRAAASLGYRDSFATNDYVEPKICHAEAVVAPKGYGFSRVKRASSNVSSTSSGSRSTSRHRHPSQGDYHASAGKSPASSKMLAPSNAVNFPLIEEPEEPADEAGFTKRSRHLAPPDLYSDANSEKRRSRIIAVTRQEQSLLEAMRQRSGRITPSIFNDLEGNAREYSPSPSPNRRPPSPKVRSPETIQSEFDTSFLRLSTVMRLSPGSTSASGENFPFRDKDTYTSLGSASDTEQRTDSHSYSASPRLSLVYSETPSSTSTYGHRSPVTPPLPSRRFSPSAPPPTHAPPPIPVEVSKHHSRRRTDSSEAIVLEETESAQAIDAPQYPLWAVKWGRDPDDIALAH